MQTVHCKLISAEGFEQLQDAIDLFLENPQIEYHSSQFHLEGSDFHCYMFYTGTQQP